MCTYICYVRMYVHKNISDNRCDRYDVMNLFFSIVRRCRKIPWIKAHWTLTLLLYNRNRGRSSHSVSEPRPANLDGSRTWTSMLRRRRTTSRRTRPRSGSTRSASTARYYAPRCGVSRRRHPPPHSPFNFKLISFFACFAGVNLLIGTEHGLMLLDRSGQGKVYQLISRRRFQQMEVLEGQNILVTISGKKNRVRVYYLSWLKSKILRTDGLVEVIK